MGDLLDFDNDDFFTSRPESLSASQKDLDEIFGISKQSESDNLDDTLEPDTSNKKKPLNEKQLEDLFGKADDDGFDFFARGDTNSVQPAQKDEIQATEKPPDVFDFFDSFSPSETSLPITTSMLEDQSLKSPDLDFLLKAQPAGMLDSTDSLLMLDPFTELPKKQNSPVMNPKVKKSTELKIDPSDDFFADEPLSPRLTQSEPSQPPSEPSQPPSETGSKMESGSRSASNGKPKRSMERSFEDLLHGLSDESDPDLDDLITHDTDYSANLESLMPPSPDKSQAVQDTDAGFATPDKHLDSFAGMDLISSTPNVDHLESSDVKEDTEEDPVVPEVRVESPEGIVGSEGSDLEEQDIKSWEMVDKEAVEREEKNLVDDSDRLDDIDYIDNDNNSALGDEVVLRRKKPSQEAMNGQDLDREESIDLSAIEDANQLDVDINKHRSELSKRGSLALRRKPSRKNRRSLLSTGEDDIFKDSTQPKTEPLPNGNGDVFDQRDSDMSPPPKKPSPSMMMPLPGMVGRPSQRRSSDDADNDSEMAYEPKRMSKPPPGAFRLPAPAPRPTRQQPESPSRESPPPAVFEKPSLRPVKRSPPGSPGKDKKTFETPILKSTPRSHDKGRRGSEDKDSLFETPSLKSVPRASKKSESEEKDVTFEKPSLRSTRKPSLEKSEDRNGDLSDFVKPSLRNTSKQVNSDIEKNGVNEPSYNRYEIPVLRGTPKRTLPDTKEVIDNHIFEKPALRSRQKLDSEVKDRSDSEPFLTRTNNTRTESSENINSFDKPLLRNTPAKENHDKADSDINNVYVKPALRKSPEKVKDSHSENKGYFDKPSLRKTENILGEDKSHTGDKDYSSGFPEMKLRKTRAPPIDSKEKSSEKPEWLQTAKIKHSKALDALQSKENCNGTSEKPTPSWLEKPQLRKGTIQVPLQETSQNQSGSPSNDVTENQSSLVDNRSRTSSTSSADDELRKDRDIKRPARDSNYTPSWMRQGRSSPAAPGFVPLTPAKSCPSIQPGTEEVPQWKKDLVQRRQSKKHSLPETPKKEESPEPDWKTNIHLRKVRHTPGPVKETSTEPEWKKAAEEKKARLRRYSIKTMVHTHHLRTVALIAVTLAPLMANCRIVRSPEVCYDNKIHCYTKEDVAAHLYYRDCWLKCVCQGAIYATCEQTFECPYGTPYQCTCKGFGCRHGKLGDIKNRWKS